MGNGEEGEFIQYYPEKVNRPRGAALIGRTKDQGHMGYWVDCMRTRKTPNASAEIGYQSAIAVHAANLAYPHRQRITLEEAKAIRTGILRKVTGSPCHSEQRKRRGICIRFY